MPALVFAPPSWKAEFLPTKLEIERARKRMSRFALRCRSRNGKGYPYRSLMRGKGMFPGLIGEELLKTRFSDLEFSTGKDLFDYDLWHPKLERVEVKTKQCGSPPQMHYHCSIFETSLHQQCDYYAFFRLMRNQTRAWFIGLIPRDDFFAASVRFKKGERDPSAGDSDWRFRETCYNVPVRTVMKHPCNRMLKAGDLQP